MKPDEILRTLRKEAKNYNFSPSAAQRACGVAADCIESLQNQLDAAVEDMRGMCMFCKLYKECDPLHPLGGKYKTGLPCVNWDWCGLDVGKGDIKS